MKFKFFINKFNNKNHQLHAFRWYVTALLVMCLGLMMSVLNYPGGFDWFYTVASALASKKHNPDGHVWYAAGLALSMFLLWPYVSSLKNSLCSSKTSGNDIAMGALRVGLVSGVLVGVEKLLVVGFSDWINKAHEVLALFTFLGMYLGIVTMLVRIMMRQRIYAFAVVFVLIPLIAIGILQFWLYLDQRHLGWVDTSWREKGIPIWLSFAFWQWLAIGFLWAGLGILNVCQLRDKSIHL